MRKKISDILEVHDFRPYAAMRDLRKRAILEDWNTVDFAVALEFTVLADRKIRQSKIPETLNHNIHVAAATLLTETECKCKAKGAP